MCIHPKRSEELADTFPKCTEQYCKISRFDYDKVCISKQQAHLQVIIF